MLSFHCVLVEVFFKLTWSAWINMINVQREHEPCVCLPHFQSCFFQFFYNMWPAWTFGNISVNCDCEGAAGSGEGTRCFERVEGHTKRKQRGVLNSHLRRKKKKKNSCQSSDSKHWWPLLNLVSTRGLYEWVKPASGTPSLTGCLLSCGTFACVLSFSRVLTHFRGGVEGRWSGGAGLWRRVLITETFMNVFVIFLPNKEGGEEESTQEVLCLLGSSLLQRLRQTQRRLDTFKRVEHLHSAAL